MGPVSLTVKKGASFLLQPLSQVDPSDLEYTRRRQVAMFLLHHFPPGRIGGCPKWMHTWRKNFEYMAVMA